MAGGSRQIFISYARSDAERVDTLVGGLRQLHYDVWLDEELTGGQEWWDTVLSQIRASSAVLVAVSLAGLESAAVRREYEYSHAVGRPLLPVVVDRVPLETLPPLLAPLQVVDYCEPGMKHAFALAAALAALPVPQMLPQPLPEPPPIPVSYLSDLMERSQAATLSMDEQLALVARLKVAFGRASERAAAEQVLRSLQNRDDLYQVSAREIESLLSPGDRQDPKPQRQEAPNAPLRESSTRKWSVNEIVREPKSLTLELRKYDSHTLEWHAVDGFMDPITLDNKKVAGIPIGGGTKTFEFEDGGEKVTAKITVGLTLWEGRLKSFKLELNNEVLYHFP
jgi:hypothetical protein